MENDADTLDISSIILIFLDVSMFDAKFATAGSIFQSFGVVLGQPAAGWDLASVLWEVRTMARSQLIEICCARKEEDKSQSNLKNGSVCAESNLTTDWRHAMSCTCRALPEVLCWVSWWNAWAKAQHESIQSKPIKTWASDRLTNHWNNSRISVG